MDTILLNWSTCIAKEQLQSNDTPIRLIFGNGDCAFMIVKNITCDCGSGKPLSIYPFPCRLMEHPYVVWYFHMLSCTQIIEKKVCIVSVPVGPSVEQFSFILFSCICLVGSGSRFFWGRGESPHHPPPGPRRGGRGRGCDSMCWRVMKGFRPDASAMRNPRNPPYFWIFLFYAFL